MFEYLVFYEFACLTPWSREIRIERVGDSIRYRIKLTETDFSDKNITEGVYKGNTENFIRKLESFHIENWPLNFSKDILDGHVWSLRYKEVGKRCRRIEGNNDYPDCYKEFMELIKMKEIL